MDSCIRVVGICLAAHNALILVLQTLVDAHQSSLGLQDRRDHQYRHLTQTDAAHLLGLTQPKLPGILRGQFRGISEAKMLDCLHRLGRDVEIVFRKRSLP